MFLYRSPINLHQLLIPARLWRNAPPVRNAFPHTRPARLAAKRAGEAGSLAFLPIFLHKDGLFHNLFIFSTQFSIFPGSKRKPLYPSFTVSGIPPILEATTGFSRKLGCSKTEVFSQCYFIKKILWDPKD